MSSLITQEAQVPSNKKSPTALRTIGEASELLDIPRYVLRFWETKFAGIIKPHKSRGRRYYSIYDVEILSQIKDLLYNKGYTIKGVQTLLHSSKVAHSIVTNAYNEEVTVRQQQLDLEYTPKLAVQASDDSEVILVDILEKLYQLRGKVAALIDSASL